MATDPAPLRIDWRAPRTRLTLVVGAAAGLSMWLYFAHAIRKPPWAWGPYTLLCFGALPLALGVAFDASGRARRVALVSGGIALVALLLSAKWGPLRGAFTAQPGWLLALAALSLAGTVGAARRGGVDLGGWGAGAGDWRWWGPKTAVLAAACVAFVVVWLWADPAMRAFYPFYKPGREDLTVLLAWCGVMTLYMAGWELFWRGVLLQGLARAAGPMVAIVATALPFMLTHRGKPETELLGSLLGGALLAGFCWRARSCWPAVLLHTTLNTSIQLVAFAW